MLAGKRRWPIFFESMEGRGVDDAMRPLAEVFHID